MENITMCKADRCKLKMTCERFIRKPDLSQIYILNEPCSPDGISCEMYLTKL